MSDPTTPTTETELRTSARWRNYLALTDAARRPIEARAWAAVRRHGAAANAKVTTYLRQQRRWQAGEAHQPTAGPLYVLFIRETIKIMEEEEPNV